MALTKVTGDMLGSSVSFGLKSVQTFTSSGTWTRPTGVTKVVVYVTGAGGGGAAGAGSANGVTPPPPPAPSSLLGLRCPFNRVCMSGQFG